MLNSAVSRYQAVRRYCHFIMCSRFFTLLDKRSIVDTTCTHIVFTVFLIYMYSYLKMDNVWRHFYIIIQVIRPTGVLREIA